MALFVTRSKIFTDSYLPRLTVLHLISFCLLSTSRAMLNQTCYYPDGKTIATKDRPCNADLKESACCGTNLDGSPAHCLSNGLCLTDLKVTRGSCTDATWYAPECANLCTKTNMWQGNIINDCGISTGLWSCDTCAESNFTMAPSICISPMERAAIIASANAHDPVPTQLLAAATVSSTSTPEPSASAAASESGGTSPMVTGAIVGGLMGLAQLVTLIIMAWLWRRNVLLRDRLRQASKRLSGPWDKPTASGAASGSGGPPGFGEGAPRGFGWDAGSEAGHGHPWAQFYQAQPRSQHQNLHPHPPSHHQHAQCPGCALSNFEDGRGHSPITPEDSSVPPGWLAAADAKPTGGLFHEMDAGESAALEKELTLPRQEKECTAPRKPPFERKWFTLRR